MSEQQGILAVLGGKPAFPEKLFVGRPNIGDRAKLMARIEDILDRRWLTNDGPIVREFESRLCAHLGVKHCVVMCNATIALEIAIRALGLTGEVIVPSFTFIATAHSLQWQQITPVFADVDPRTHCLDPVSVERMITPRTTGIIGVHLWGIPCAVEELALLAERRNLKLLYDSAHAFGSTHLGKSVGGFGSAEVFSFHATKFFNTLEGGAVTTNDDELAEKMKLMRNFGFAGFDKVIYIGTNGKMNEICAAMGLTSFDALQSFLDVNERHYHHYRDELSDFPGVKLLAYDAAESCNYQYIVLEIDEASAGLCRDEIMKVLWKENVIARRYFYPGCHRMEPYRSYYPHAGLLLPETEALCDRVLLLPNGTALNSEDVQRICEIIQAAVADAAAVRQALSPANPKYSSRSA